MKKGFTLIEVLAVLLIIAVVASMTVPLLRKVNYQVKNSQAKTAALKLAEALRSYYQTNRGYTIESTTFSPTNADNFQNIIMATPSECNSPVATGIPSTASRPAQEVKQLFACGYLSFKDFKGLPYKFVIGSGADADIKAPSPDGTPKDKNFIKLGGNIDAVFALGVDGSGSRFEFKPADNNYIYVDGTLKPKDTYQ